MSRVGFHKSWIILAGVVALTAVGCFGEAVMPAQGVTPEVGVSVGNIAPDFTLVLSDGSTVDQAALLAGGKPVLLYFFATW
jgi:cytochrome oxidase Cu insertion factor (SCO1/SenC/PrrC family)